MSSLGRGGEVLQQMYNTKDIIRCVRDNSRTRLLPLAIPPLRSAILLLELRDRVAGLVQFVAVLRRWSRLCNEAR